MSRFRLAGAVMAEDSLWPVAADPGKMAGMSRFLFLGLVLAVGCAGFLPADTRVLPLGLAIGQAGKIVRSEVAPKVPGGAVTVAVDGKVVWSEGFGYADLAAKKAATPETRFRIGSVSKPLSSAGLALLVERGLVKMDEPVQTYLPDLPRRLGGLTLRQLGGHLSGVRNYRGREMFLDHAFPSLRSGLVLFENDPLEHAPGTTFGYSSYNWNVIGAVMERLAKQDFPGYMEDAVFKPLGMTSTGPDRAGARDPNRALFYEENASRAFVVAPSVDSSYKWPAGGFLSTTEDLVRFGDALLGPGFLKPGSLRLLFTSQRTAAGAVTHYGLGWFIGRTIVYHGGDGVGGTATLLLLPESRVVVAIACNRGHFAVVDRAGHPAIKTADDHFSSVVLTRQAHRIADIFAAVPMPAKVLH